MLALAVIPLGIVRNGFRIYTIAMLCVHIDPEMINSPLHRRGGPVFFALSLLPFFALLFLLQKSEKAAVKNAENQRAEPRPKPGRGETPSNPD